MADANLSFFQRVPAALLALVAIERARSASDCTLAEKGRDNVKRLQRRTRARMGATTKRR